ncbi:hypothetical protein EX895_005971 [Sporisorium graminicola]|uniref:Uncharacterized protein n=1 Tax=Sporisorium graminicola TaxID=280036 RepID=A0A4U7KL32_9BASI|nr:hypothetical protein EX895_005971 [Sporisorium graminicola]TKY84891.1 hypothetical protein EX895_005971 [Sporisorium graminicola]
MSQGGPFWPATGQPQSYLSPQGELTGFRYSYIPTIVYQPVLVHHSAQYLDPATLRALPQGQIPVGSRRGASVSSGMSHFGSSYPLAPPSAPVPRRVHPTLPQSHHSMLEGAKAVEPRAGMSSRVGEMSNDFEAGSSRGVQETEPHQHEVSLPTEPSATRPLLPVALLPNTVRKRKQQRKPELSALERAIRERQESDPLELPLRADQIQRQLVRDPKFFSGAPFRLSTRADPEISLLVKRLRSPETTSGASEHGQGSQEQLAGQFPKNLDQFLRSFFFHRKKAKQVLLRTHDGTRSLLVIYLTETQRLSHTHFDSHVSVWEFAPSGCVPAPSSRCVLDLYCYGFYPFSASDFLDLDAHPQSTGQSYWIELISKVGVKPDQQLPLIVSAAEPDTAQIDASVMTQEVEHHPEIQALLQSGEIQRALSTSSYVVGRHLYVVQEFAPDVIAAIGRWEREAQLPSRTFDPVKLDEKQIDLLPQLTVAAYRKGKHVKVVTEPNGEMYMLEFHSRLRWLQQHPRGVVTVWKLGPEVSQRRLLIFKGSYRIKGQDFYQLTPRNVHGLRDSFFKSSQVELP